MLTQTTERQKPCSAKNKAFEVVGKVDANNPVGRHITLYAFVGQDCFFLLYLARYGYTNGCVKRRVPILKPVIKIPSSDRPLSTWPMKQPLADRFADRMLRETCLRGTIKYLACGQWRKADMMVDTFMGEIGETMSKGNGND